MCQNSFLFQPTRPLRGATANASKGASKRDISTHAPLAGRDAIAAKRPTYRADFNPRAPCGARLCHKFHIFPTIRFQPTRPLRGATLYKLIDTESNKFQPTRPLRGATKKLDSLTGHGLISTHAPLAGRDAGFMHRLSAFDISTHAPLAGRDYIPIENSDLSIGFQPTRPLRGATNQTEYKHDYQGISTHAPLAGRDSNERGNNAKRRNISTHAPLAGRDGSGAEEETLVLRISTHAPLAGRDGQNRLCWARTDHFNPRAPCGARPRSSARRKG